MEIRVKGETVVLVLLKLTLAMIVATTQMIRVVVLIILTLAMIVAMILGVVLEEGQEG